jgi:two-component system LytT family sensor kinase
MEKLSARLRDSSVPQVRINWPIAFACAAVITLAASTQNIAVFAVSKANLSFPRSLIEPALGWGLWLPLLPLIFAIGRSGRARGFSKPGTITTQLLAALGVVSLHTLLLGLTRWGLGMTLTKDPWVAVRNLASFFFVADVLRYWMIAAAYHLLAYQQEMRDRATRESRLATKLAEAKLDALERRLHPHFLFNTLNTIAALIRKDPPAAAAMVGNLSDLLRAAVYSEPGREITLATELDLLARYTDIQLARFSDRLRMSVSAPPEVLPAYVPNMILQPIVENAIRHGIAPREAAGMLTLDAERQGERLRLIVRDDGVGRKRATNGGPDNGFGINGTRARLTQLYGEDFSFAIDDCDPTGTVVTIDLPFHTDGPRGPRAIA